MHKPGNILGKSPDEHVMLASQRLKGHALSMEPSFLIECFFMGACVTENCQRKRKQLSGELLNVEIHFVKKMQNLQLAIVLCYLEANVSST